MCLDMRFSRQNSLSELNSDKNNIHHQTKKLAPVQEGKITYFKDSAFTSSAVFCLFLSFAMSFIPCNMQSVL
jgi:hypothetical protein